MAESVQDTLARANALLTQTGFTGTRSVVQNSAGQYVVNPEYTATMDASKLASTAPKVDLPPAPTVDNGSAALSTIPTNYDNASTGALLSAYMQPTQAETESNSMIDRILSGVKSLSGREASQQAADEAAGVNQLKRDLNETMTQIRQLQAESQIATIKAEDRVAPTFAIQGEQAQIERQRSMRALGLSATAQAIQGNLTLAQDQANKAVELQYAPIQAEIDYLTKALELNEGKLNREEQKRATLLQFQLQERQRVIDNAKAEKDAIFQLLQKAQANTTVPKSVIQNAINAKTAEEAFGILSQYLSPQEKALTQKEILENQKIQAEINKINTETSKVLDEIAAGKEPSEGSVAIIGLINGILGDAGSVNAVTGIPGPTAYIPGTKAQYTIGQIDQILGLAKLEARKELKGTGPISDFETRMLEGSLTAIGQKLPGGTYRLSNEDMAKELVKFRGITASRMGYSVPIKFTKPPEPTRQAVLSRDEIGKLLLSGYQVEYQ